MDLDKLNEFIKLMDENSLVELEIEEEGSRIKLKKATELQNIQPHFVPMGPASNQNQSQAPEAKFSGIEIASPMVGTFYRAASPGAKPYVEVGDIIKAGDIVCIIEAMKLMNEIKAEVSGKITSISVDNGQPVEFGQKLFEIEPE
jgi:acetyl-CoA carboxylase biotin carboxyl carrier protein